MRAVRAARASVRPRCPRRPRLQLATTAYPSAPAWTLDPEGAGHLQRDGEVCKGFHEVYEGPRAGALPLPRGTPQRRGTSSLDAGQPSSPGPDRGAIGTDSRTGHQAPHLDQGDVMPPPPSLSSHSGLLCAPPPSLLTQSAGPPRRRHFSVHRPSASKVQTHAQRVSVYTHCPPSQARPQHKRIKPLVFQAVSPIQVRTCLPGPPPPPPHRDPPPPTPQEGGKDKGSSQVRAPTLSLFLPLDGPQGHAIEMTSLLHLIHHVT